MPSFDLDSALKEPKKTLEILDPLQKVIEVRKWNSRQIEIYCLRSLAWHALGNTSDATAELEKALVLGEAENYIRTFVEAGEPMRRLLIHLRTDLSRSARSASYEAYINRLLNVFAQPLHVKINTESDHAAVASDQFNQRELEILRYIADGYSNREIAEKLILANSTVKWYINSLYTKLGARSRTHALALARDFNLL